MRFDLLILLLYLAFTNAFGQDIIKIKNDTPIIYKVLNEEIRVFEDSKKKFSFNEIFKNLDFFQDPRSFKKINPKSAYWMIHKIKNDSRNDKTVRFVNGNWNKSQTYVVRENKSIEKLRLQGRIGTYNEFSKVNPTVSSSKNIKNQYAVFTLNPYEKVTLVTRVVSNYTFPVKNFDTFVYDHNAYSQLRRLGIYIEGIMIGAIFALAIFAAYSAFRSDDKTSFYYAIWLVCAFSSILTQHTHDGIRFSEFFFMTENYDFSDEVTLAWVIWMFFAFAQAMMYVVFARTFLNLRMHYPVVYFFTNIYLLWYAVFFVIHIFIRPSVENHQMTILLPNLIVTPMILLAIFVCAFLRFLKGMQIAKIFMLAAFPYLFFRSIFLASYLEIPNPFSYLPDQGFGLFFQSNTTVQILGMFFEAIIMALAVVARTRQLQEDLTLSANKQKDLVENQNILLETKVTERTKELLEEQKIVSESLNYASRLQKGQLPRDKRLKERFKSFDFIWEPRDTIGGDLWWISPNNNKKEFSLALVDCTGHGVPGAMVSLLVSTSLEKIYQTNNEIDPSDSLVLLDSAVRAGLNQDKDDAQSDDGCDVGVLKIDKSRNLIKFAGAKIDLYKIKSDGIVTRYRGSRISLGYQEKLNKIPKDVELNFKTDDLFVMTTDGLTDQIGGLKQRKHAFGNRRLENFFKRNFRKNTAQIVKNININLKRWQGKEIRRDDVTVIAFKI